MMKIPNADFLERTKSEILGARLWRLPPTSANTLHRHPKMEEFYFVVEGVGRIRIGDKTLTVPQHGGVLIGPEQLRQVFNDTETEVLWLIIGALEKELEDGETLDQQLLYPADPKTVAERAGWSCLATEELIDLQRCPTIAPAPKFFASSTNC